MDKTGADIMVVHGPDLAPSYNAGISVDPQGFWNQSILLEPGYLWGRFRDPLREAANVFFSGLATKKKELL